MRQLNNIYKALEKMGFYVEHIQKALQQNFGKDLSGILDWLCLNVPHDQLPSGFAGSNYYRTDGSKIVITMPTVKPKKIDSSNKKEEETNLEIPQFSNVQLLSSKEKRDSNISNSNSPDQKENSKKWIQNYLSNLQEEEEEEKDLEEEQMLTEYAKLVIKLNALEDEKKTLQQNDRMKLKLIDTKINELKKSTAQVEKNKKFQRESPRVKAKIEEILALKKKKQEEQMRIKLEQRRLAKEEKERKEKEEKERNEKELSEGIFSLDSMFQEPVSNEQAPKTTKFVHYRNYTIPSSWSGQTPKQLLIDLCKKKFLLCNTPTFKNISSPGSGGACFAVTIYKSPTESEVIQMTETCETSHEAENYVATMALYKYWKDQPIYNLLPPLFRQLWLDWLQNETDLAKELQEKQNVERFQFLTKLIEENKKSKKNSNTASKHQKFPQRGEQGQTNKNEEEEKFEQIQIFQNPEEEKQFFLNILLERTNSNEYKQYEAVRKQLPIFEFKEQIRNFLKNQSKVIIISGETGCGKKKNSPYFQFNV